ncbi:MULTISPECIES: acyloxyacyl hydrolase [Alphaproteobacteria]|uniref:Acyloxyacyl hydrolase n=2 Tax=Alphaproteobacteria TaxID=28211 RepID=A0A512HPU7_9HYPH|nr:MULTISPECIES: acyloxyacyl hydrolase [Alphaproteobacteria]GEO87476.1 acyloxyacyl hydrolase [Ciceribacter naphthalenivorans]GLR23556.1 acyloxyacyl hydrolase [Ciceribacter naphthalenivorans]GLT06412.1 acyloxyacyl hydrolase [Sphingomonas psychrolutea]
MWAFSSIAVASVLLVAATQNCFADDRIFDELRFGGSASVQDRESREDGVFPEVTVFFDPFDLNSAADWTQQITRPRINLGASIATSDEANQVFGGLSWQIDLTAKIFAEAGFGGVWHDGKLSHNPDGPELGCRFLFREYVGAGYRFDPHWSVIAQIAHSSHADLCDDPNNDGTTRTGIQIGYKF